VDYLNLFFYLTLALMLSALFNGRGPVLGIALVVAWSGPRQFIAQPMQKYAPWLDSILPRRLMIDLGLHAPLAGYLAHAPREEFQDMWDRMDPAQGTGQAGLTGFTV
jgi:hypothetical protein